MYEDRPPLEWFAISAFDSFSERGTTLGDQTNPKIGVIYPKLLYSYAGS